MLMLIIYISIVSTNCSLVCIYNTVFVLTIPFVLIRLHVVVYVYIL